MSQQAVLIADENARLRAENERLTAQREKLADALRKIASCELRVKGDVVDVARTALASFYEFIS